MKNEINYIKKSGNCYTAYLNSDYGAKETNMEFSYAQLRHILEVVYDIKIPAKNKLKLYGKDKYGNEYFILPEQSTIYLDKAEYSKLSNDLFWRCSFFDRLTNEYITLRWTGYNDGFWWNNVAPTEQARIRKGGNGKSYRIDFTTNEVFEVVA